ncbi:MAG: hypothetical protein KDG50_07075 [Chromatiales bacterium]|nr:hypothetical protein [Chromatiales bacterium]
MTTLTSSATLAIGDAPTAVESVQINVIPVAAPGTGKGRLVHPTLGTYDYHYKPDAWRNFDGDIVVPPVWGSAQTLTSATNAVWPGSIRDVTVEELWTGEGGISMRTEQLRMFLAMWATPVDPADGAIEWYPSYTSSLGFKVAIVEVISGQQVTFDDLARAKDRLRYPVTLKMRILDRA